MSIVRRLMDQLRKHEGVRRFVYKDSVGVLTIGVGRNLEHKGLNDNEINYLLANDVWESIQAAEKYAFYRDLSEARKAVIINMIFNLGEGGFSKFKRTHMAIRARDYRSAAAEMLDSKWATQVGRRARELAKQMETGEWQDA